MNYIVLDLEWNQGNGEPQDEDEKLMFEIIEIGAVKLNDQFVMIDEFSRLVKPEVYHELHQITSTLINLQMQELERGRPFTEVMEAFRDWCGEEEYIFCTWGSTDLTELQRNMQFHNLEPLSDGPIAFYDVQKLFSLAYEDGKVRRSLESAIDFLHMDKDIPFHRAFSDAYYTAKILEATAKDQESVLSKYSYDTYHPPVDRKSEIKKFFGTYMKYISREFETKADAFADKEVASSKCYLCHKNLKKKLKWFTPNGKHYYCLAWCDKHGFLKAKIRVHKSENDKIFVVKTTKLISQEEADIIKLRSEHVKELRKMKNQKKETTI